MYKDRNDNRPLEFYHYYISIFDTDFYTDERVVTAQIIPTCEVKNYKHPFRLDMILTAYCEKNANKIAEKFINDWFYKKKGK